MNGQSQAFQASAAATEATIGTVRYYLNNVLVGESSTAPYTLNWTPTTWGDYFFTAIGTDSLGRTSFRSPEVKVSVPYDSDGNGLCDAWEMAEFGHLGNNAAGNPDGDLRSNFEEYLDGTDPNDFYNGQTPQINILGGSLQEGYPGEFLPVQLEVEVKIVGGDICRNAPVTFVVTGGGGVATTNTGTPTPTTPFFRNTDENGRAQVYFKMPSASDSTPQVTVSTGTATPVTFNLTLLNTLPAPVLSLSGGRYATRQNVTVTCAAPGAVIHYTTNGDEPTESDPTVTSGGTVLVDKTMTLKSKAFRSGVTPSDTTSISYQITGQIACGYYHTLSLKSDGSVWTWGTNWGNGAGLEDDSPKPVMMNGGTPLTQAVAVAGGGYHSLVLKSDGTVWTWGANWQGQLGDGTTQDRPGLVQVMKDQTTALTDVAAIAGGKNHTLVAKRDGTVWAWGTNWIGELGQNPAETAPDFYRPYPGQVMVDETTPLTDVVAVAAGEGFSVALKSDGTVWAWGMNWSGQVGSTRPGWYNPGPVMLDETTPLTGVIAISCGVDYAVAIKSDGTTWAWGANDYGQLGNGVTWTPRFNPVQVPMNNLLAISAVGYHTTALKNDGTVWAWGSNDFGELGDNASGNNWNPVQVLTDAVCVANGAYHSAAVKTNGSVWAWGLNGSGQLGIPKATNRYSPLLVMAGGSLPLADITTVASGGSMLALKGDGTLWAWGSNAHGEVGDGTLANRPNPVPVIMGASSPMNGVRAISAGQEHSVAIRHNGSVWAWGNNSYGQLGDGTTSDKLNPVAVMINSTESLGNVAKVASGWHHNLAVKQDGSVWAWGASGGAYASQVLLDSGLPLSDVLNVAGGAEHSAIVKTNGTVWTWGLNSEGQLGDGSFEDRSGAVQVMVNATTPLSDVAAIACGALHTVVVKHDGTVWAWGSNSNGQLGSDELYSRENAVQVMAYGSVPLDNVVAVACGQFFTLALKNDGTVWAWGENITGQLGNGTFVDQYSPVQVNGIKGAIAVVGGADTSYILLEDGHLARVGADSDTLSQRILQWPGDLRGAARFCRKLWQLMPRV